MHDIRINCLVRTFVHILIGDLIPRDRAPVALGRGVWGEGELSALAWHSTSALFTTWRICLARFSGSLKPGDRPRAD